jgi:hypothetical protein
MHGFDTHAWLRLAQYFHIAILFFVLPFFAAANEASATPGMMLGVVCHPMVIAVKSYRLVVCKI